MEPYLRVKRPWIFLSLACLVPATLDVAQVVLQGLVVPQNAPDLRLIIWQGGEWVILGALMPIVAALGRRFPLRQPRVRRHLAVHVAGALMLCAGWAGVGVGLRLVLGRAPTDVTFTQHLVGWMLWSLPWSVFMYFGALGAVHAVTFWVEAREREAQAARLAAQVAEARLAALRMQWNPHFLLNSLNAVLVLVRDGEMARAERMIELLGGVLREVLRTDARALVPLSQELRFLEDYLAVEEVRFSDRLQVTRDVAPEVEGVLVPPFLLQPLVENALRHGIGANVAGGLITLSARREGEELVLAVEDTGAGAPNARGDVPWGVGLGNTRERLETLYGERGRLTLSLRGGGGAVAEVRLPFVLPHAEPATA